MSTTTAFQYHTELIGGIELEKPLPKNLHSFVQTFLIQRFGSDLPPHYRVLSEMNVRCGQDRLVPDVAIAARDAKYLDGDLLGPPLLAVEIMSPGQRLSSLIDKSERLIANGVDICWIIWPEKQKAWTCTAEGLVEQGRTLHALDGLLSFTLAEIWEQLT